MASDSNSRPYHGLPPRREYVYNNSVSSSTINPYDFSAQSHAAQQPHRSYQRAENAQVRGRGHGHSQIGPPPPVHGADSQGGAPRRRSRAFSFDRLGLGHIPIYQELNRDAAAVTTSSHAYELEFHPKRRETLSGYTNDLHGYPAGYQHYRSNQASQHHSSDYDVQKYLNDLHNYQQHQQQQQLHQPTTTTFASPYYNDANPSLNELIQGRSRSRSSTINHPSRLYYTSTNDSARGRSGSNASIISTMDYNNGPQMNLIPPTPPKERIALGAEMPIHSPPMPPALWSQMEMLELQSGSATTPRELEDWEKELYEKIGEKVAALSNGKNKAKQDTVPLTSRSSPELGRQNKSTAPDASEEVGETLSAFALAKTSTHWSAHAGLFGMGINTIWSPVNMTEFKRAASPIRSIKAARRTRQATPLIERQEVVTDPSFHRGPYDDVISLKQDEDVVRIPSPFDSNSPLLGVPNISRTSSFLDVRYPTPLSSMSSDLTGSSASSSPYPELALQKENGLMMMQHPSGYFPFDPYSDFGIMSNQKLAFKRAKHWSVARQSLDASQFRIRKVVLGKKLLASDEHVAYIANRPVAIAELEIFIVEGHPELSKDSQITDKSVMKLCKDLGQIGGAGGGGSPLRIIVLDACPFVSDASFAEIVGNCPMIEYIRISAGGGSEHGGVKMRGKITDKSIALLYGNSELVKHLKELVLYDQSVRKDTARELTAVREGLAARVGKGVVKKGSERLLYWRKPNGEPDYREVSVYFKGEEIYWDTGDERV